MARPQTRSWTLVAALCAALVLVACSGAGGGTGEPSSQASPPAPQTSAPSATGTPSSSPSPIAERTIPSHAPGPFPGYLLIADRGNNRAILIDGRKQTLWRYPTPGQKPQMPFRYDDDTFFSPNYDSIISNQEDQHTVQVISFPKGRLTWHYGHVDHAGSAPGLLHTPDDAYLLPNGDRVVADVGNCRVLIISPRGHVVRQFGTTGSCGHAPPRFLGSPNGDTPIPGGGFLITEINGSWVDALGPTGKLRWSVRAPVAYPSDAQWLGHGQILLADYSSPGHVLIMSRKGKVLWRYGPASGPGRLDHPSLAMMLPNGLIAVNDDFRHRVVLIDPKTDEIVWQYGHTDHAGRSAGFLNTPDGMDFLPFKVAMRTPRIRALVLKGNG